MSQPWNKPKTCSTGSPKAMEIVTIDMKITEVISCTTYYQMNVNTNVLIKSFLNSYLVKGSQNIDRPSFLSEFKDESQDENFDSWSKN